MAMIRCTLLALAALWTAAPMATAQQPSGLAAANRQLAPLQGEYLGELLPSATSDPSKQVTHGAQLIALCGRDGSSAQLQLVLLTGGLAGAGWRRGDEVASCVASVAENGAATFSMKERTFELSQGKLVARDEEGRELGRLVRVERSSPTLGAKPPAGATVLFDGSSAAAFEGGRMLDGGLLAVGCDSKQRFGDHRIHLEFRTPFRPAARGQGRGNSGVYVQGRYECQVLDSFGLEGKNNECGGIYSIAAPIVNACLPPGQWQTYDIVFSGARWQGLKKVENARMTVHLNGVLVHDDVELPRVTTAAKRKESDSDGGLYLQDHGNPVAYRNVWVVERDPTRRRKVVFLTGGPSHGYASHEHRAGCMLLAKALGESGLAIDTEVHRLWPEDPTTLDTADVIVSFADGGGRHPLLRHTESIAKQMARGASLVCLHYAVEVPSGAPGDRFVDWLGGYFETHWSVNPWWTARFEQLPDHPVARGVKPFAIHDEWYFHMRFLPGMESVTPILSSTAPESTMRRKDGPHSGNPHVRAAVAAGKPQHLAWVRVRPDGGRAFGFTGAHVHWNWGHDDFRKVVLNGIVWCAHLDVPVGGVASETPNLAALQANQDGKPGKRYDAARVKRLLESFGK